MLISSLESGFRGGIPSSPSRISTSGFSLPLNLLGFPSLPWPPIVSFASDVTGHGRLAFANLYHKEQKCIVFNWSLAKAITVVRSATDFIYFLHMLLQFRLAYVAPESRVVGAGDLVDQPKKIVMHYLRGYFLLDLFVVLPLPQVMILVVIPKYVGTSSANYAKNLLRFTVLLQYIPRIIRFLPLLAGQSASGFIFESAWANFVINLLMFVLAGHVVGSCWYLFGLQVSLGVSVSLTSLLFTILFIARIDNE
ncbi:hypothetical protein IEQ34_026357 [Dendrobium chrysotoxum]|uniref:Ion transport domain-containing protein n=1 Tax=Dendrobium chrysotoxum TaxID=161865 RepID=A0AAV7FN69_DENCH|nr:hypothetical protein IEQ34_026357 [Dendrobium chrysotoxum]